MKPQINAKILIWPYVWGSMVVSVLGLVLAIPTHGWTLPLPIILLPATLFRVALLAARKVYVTDRSVCIKAGIFSRDVEELSLRKIESVELRQGLTGRLFGSDRSEVLYQVVRT